ncbi:hypothetical protein DEO23_12230 [Brachybacterium endophyticum]|uniref:Uncharacterized protein n=1 Tax=Brachybacterium endophyticum TaxID=2182385 RepID=A0A2U2RI96_9MICO|nr:hypothetical protein DEO23_12230 [Brachybacterium endophyticum]
MACLAVVEDGVPMQTLSKQLGRGPTWVHWLLSRHDCRPHAREGRSTARRTRPTQTPGGLADTGE